MHNYNSVFNCIWCWTYDRLLMLGKHCITLDGISTYTLCVIDVGKWSTFVLPATCLNEFSRMNIIPYSTHYNISSLHGQVLVVSLCYNGLSAVPQLSWYITLLILDLHPAIQWRCYLVTTSLIGWAPLAGSAPADSSFASSQWETALLSNYVFNWLAANLEWALHKSYPIRYAHGVVALCFVGGYTCT